MRAQDKVLAAADWLQSLPVGIGVFAADTTLLFANPRFFELLGLAPTGAASLGNLAGLLAAIGSSGNGGATGSALLATQFAGEPQQTQPAQWHRSDARVIDIVASPLPDGGRAITLSDVTPLTRAQQEAKAHADALQAILEAIPHGICVYGPDRRVTMFNRAYAQVMNDAPLAVGEHIEQVIRRRAEAGEYGPGEPEEVFRHQLAFNLGRAQSRRRRRPNGTVIDIRTEPLPDGGHISVVTDITALTEAEAEITRRADEMGVMLASIRQGILLWGPDRRLIASNAIASELLNHPPGALTPGRSQDDLLDAMEERGELGPGAIAQEMFRKLRNRDPSKPYTRQAITSAGRTLSIQSEPTPAGGWVTTYTDVTEARRAEEELRQAKEAAETASQAKSRFLATMSHELRTPLNAVIGFSEALLREAAVPSPARIEEFARQINESGRNLLKLIDIILDVARIESGRFDLASERIDVGRLIRNAVRQAEASAQAAALTLTSEVPATLPPLRADERRVAQVLNHLLSNAIKFTAAGGSVTVGARREPGGLLIFVRDSGIGIAEENLERVFEPFTQLDETLARRFEGAGLGLYLCRALIAGHGGTLTLKSRLGEGTTVEVRFPGTLLAPGGR